MFLLVRHQPLPMANRQSNGFSLSVRNRTLDKANLGDPSIDKPALSGSFFFSIEQHRGNFEQIRPLCRHGTKSYEQFLRSCCLMAAKISQSHGDVRQLHELRDPLGIIPIGSFDPWRQPTSSCATTPKESERVVKDLSGDRKPEPARIPT